MLLRHKRAATRSNSSCPAGTHGGGKANAGIAAAGGENVIEVRYAAIIASPVGPVGMQLLDGAVCAVAFLPRRTPLRDPDSVQARRAGRVLGEYFDDPRSGFAIPFVFRGTPFQERVWRALTAIPVGCTLTYGELAARLGTAPRAIGGACRQNPVPLIVPCHRIVSGTGLGGYHGSTGRRALERKRWLLRHEGVSLD
jgi:methylated-DNA-[protein]-cysteine S-methyltransferase